MLVYDPTGKNDVIIKYSAMILLEKQKLSCVFQCTTPTAVVFDMEILQPYT